MFSAILVALVVVAATSVQGAPIRKRSAGNTVEFHMPNSDYLSFPWTTQNSTLAQISTDSKDVYPGSGIDCPDKVQEGADVPLHLRSTCPWYYEAEHKSTRYPTTILQAYRACRTCIGSNGQYECEPIKRTISVLEKISKENSTVLFLESEIEINVGFTCAGARTAQSGSQDQPSDDLPDFA